MGRLLLPNMRFPGLTAALVLSLLLAYYLGEGGGRFSLEELAAMGASSAQIIADSGEGSRLIVANFLHESPLHLWGNVALLLIIGTICELFFYRLDLLFIYAFGALSAMLAALSDRAAVTYGASGLIFAALAATIVICYRYRRNIKPGYRRLLFIILPIYTLLLLLAGLKSGGVSVLAHIGGLGAGFICGRLFIVCHPAGLATHQRLKWLFLVLGLILIPLMVPKILVTKAYLFADSHYGVTFMAPSGWLIEKASLPKGEAFALQNSLGVTIYLESRLLADGVTDEELHFKENSEQYEMDGVIITSSNYIYLKGFYQYVLSCRVPLPLAELYAPWCQKAKNSLEFSPPDSLKAAKLRAENRVPLLSDYITFGDELMLYGAYSEGLELWAELAKTMNESGQIAYHYARWLTFMRKKPAVALDEARQAVDILGAHGEPLYLLMELLAKEKRYAEMKSYLISADEDDEKLLPYRALAGSGREPLRPFTLPGQ